MNNNYLLSIITVNLNYLEGLKKTTKSVFDQTLQNFEFIIIDGGSIDGSKEFIEANTEYIDYWISEPDSGIYNAMNKGLKQSKGKYVLFLNSGDWLVNNTILEVVRNKMSSNAGIYYGNVNRIYGNNDIIEKKYPPKLSFDFFLDSALAHQAVFIKRELFDKIFYYSEDYKILADWEFLVVAICKYNIKTEFLDLVISYYPMDGISSVPENRNQMKLERERCYKKHFPRFIEDYRCFKELQVRLNNDRIKLFFSLERRPVIRKVNFLFMRLLDKLS